jgi:hypothetical protein
MKLLMPAGRRRVALRTTLVPLASRCAAVAYGILASDHAVLAGASPARITGRRQSFAIVDLAVLEPTACKYKK